MPTPGPEFGGRIELRLLEVGSDTVHYTAELATGFGRWTARAQIETGTGTVQYSQWEVGDPPEWLVRALHGILRAIWRTQQTGGTWSRRISRWRKAPGE